MKTTIALAALLLLPLLGCSARAERPAANQTAHDLAQQCDREIAGVWDGLSKGLDSLKSARRTSEVSNVFTLARSSTNGLARIASEIEVFQDRLGAIITNEIDRQPVERTVKQELRSYVENDLQTLQAVKSTASEDMDAISDLLSKHEQEWAAMMNVLTRLYPEPQCMEIMQRRFSAAADELRAKIEAHRMAAAPVEPAAETVAAPEPPVRDITAARNDPPPSAMASPNPPMGTVMVTSQDGQTDNEYASLTAPARQIAMLARFGCNTSELRSRIVQNGPFLLTADQIILLKADGISEDVIQAMLKRDRILRRRR